MILINGYFLCRRLTGIERYAIEITKRLDGLCGYGEIAIIIPGDLKNIPAYKNIKIIKYKKITSHFIWQFFHLQFFLFRNRKYIILDYGNTCLPLFPGIIFLHDVYCEFFPKDFRTIKEKIIRLYNRWQYRLICKKAKKIVTVSNFIKKQIIDTFKVKGEKVVVIYNSWEHFKDIKADYSVFADYQNLQKNGYYFSLGSLSIRKNLEWIVAYAKKNPKTIFVISGASMPTLRIEKMDNEQQRNIIMLGYQDDSKVKALMENCRAFILSSYYEGFGLTPLEALSCGAKIVVSNAASLPEIYADAAHYIDPFISDINLEDLLLNKVQSPDLLLKKYTYKKSSLEVYKIIKEFNSKRA